MARRYNRWHLRFDQPDPYNGSYDLSSPQSLNRYAYVRNDPTNHTDPSGLMACYIDGTMTDCNSAFNMAGSGAGVGIFGPVDRFRYNGDRHTWEELRVYVDSIGYLLAGAVQRGPLLWGWTDLSEEPYPSYSYTLAFLPPQSLRRIGRSGYSIDYLDFHRFMRKADVDRRMAEGNRLDRQREWDICAEPTRQYYHDLYKQTKSDNNFTVGVGGFVAGLLGPAGLLPAFGLAVDRALDERHDINMFNREFMHDAQEKCGLRPPH